MEGGGCFGGCARVHPKYIYFFERLLFVRGGRRQHCALPMLEYHGLEPRRGIYLRAHLPPPPRPLPTAAQQNKSMRFDRFILWVKMKHTHGSPSRPAPPRLGLFRPHRPWLSFSASSMLWSVAPYRRTAPARTAARPPQPQPPHRPAASADGAWWTSCSAVAPYTCCSICRCRYSDHAVTSGCTTAS